ncbi:MAG TPA: hypothetical protein VFG60_03620, partial [Burkholderiaceae bacterium]|nr:hypothetical protein [Burkholderiaceae bacterium]
VFVAKAQQWAGASDRGQRWAARIVGVTLMGGAALTLAFAWQTSTTSHADAMVLRPAVLTPGHGSALALPLVAHRPHA